MLKSDAKMELLEDAKAELATLKEEYNTVHEEQQVRLNKMGAAQSVINYLSMFLETPQGAEPYMKSTPEEDFQLIKSFEYPINGTWQDKIKSVLNYTCKVMKIAEMVEVMTREEKNGGGTSTPEQIQGVVSNNVSVMTKKGLLFIYDPGIKMKGYFYGNPAWMDAYGKLDDKYKPNFNKKTLW